MFRKPSLGVLGALTVVVAPMMAGPARAQTVAAVEDSGRTDDSASASFQRDASETVTVWGQRVMTSERRAELDARFRRSDDPCHDASGRFVTGACEIFNEGELTMFGNRERGFSMSLTYEDADIPDQAQRNMPYGVKIPNDEMPVARLRFRF